MPDKRRSRGPHPKDAECFSLEQLPSLRRAAGELSWMLERGYPPRASLALVGDRHALRDRQRRALQRVAAGETECRARQARAVGREHLAGALVEVDGYNVLLTLEAALSGGVLLLARDGALRDLASLSRRYQRVEATRKAIGLVDRFLERAGCAGVRWLLDRPVANGDRLRRLIEAETSGSALGWEVRLSDRVDQTLAGSRHIVATADSAVLDRCERWLNLARLVVEAECPDAWIVDLCEPAGPSRPR